MKYNDAVRELQFKRHKKFILTGEEIYLKDTFIKAVLEVSNNSEVFNYYPGDEEEIESILYSSGLFEDDRLIILNYYDEMNNSKIKKIIQNFDGFLIVVLSPEANLKSASLVEIAGFCIHVLCSKMSEFNHEYPAWLITKAHEKGYSFVDSAEDLMYQKIGPDMMALSLELNKLILYKKDSQLICPDDVERVVGFSDATVYDILEGILKKDINHTLKSFDDFTKCNDNIDSLIFFLGHYFEKLYRMVLLHSEKMSVESMASILNLPPMVIRTKYLPKAISLGLDKLASILCDISSLEANLRKSYFKKILFNKFIFSFG